MKTTTACEKIIVEKRKQLKAKTILVRKRINSKIIETGAEIVS